MLFRHNLPKLLIYFQQQIKVSFIRCLCLSQSAGIKLKINFSNKNMDIRLNKIDRANKKYWDNFTDFIRYFLQFMPHRFMKLSTHAKSCKDFAVRQRSASGASVILSCRICRTLYLVFISLLSYSKAWGTDLKSWRLYRYWPLKPNHGQYYI